MFKNLPESVLRERDIMHRAKLTGGILKCLPMFLGTLSKDKKTSRYIASLEAELKKAEKEQDQNMAQAIEWAKDKITKLKTSPFAKHKLVRHTIERAEKALDNKAKLSSAVHLDIVLTNLQQAAAHVAAFGNDPLFDEWAVIGEARIEPKGIATKFAKNAAGLLPISISKRRALANHFGHGVEQWLLSTLKVDEGKAQIQTVNLLYGVFKKFTLPDCIEYILSGKGAEGHQNWEENCDSDPATLLKFLKILALYSFYKSTKEPSFLRYVRGAHELCLQGEPRPYLRQFSSTNPNDHPLSREQVLQLIDAFLNMVERHIAHNSNKPPVKKGATKKTTALKQDTEKAVNWMKTKWANDKEAARDIIVGRLFTAIRNGEVKLTREYKRSSYIRWARTIDPLPLADRLRRPKTRNRK